MVKPSSASALLLSTRRLACVHSKEIESRRYTVKHFNSSPVRRSSSSLTSSGGSCHFAVLRNSLIWLALGPPTSSVPGGAAPSASVNPKAFKARETCCWSDSYSILHCHNVGVLPEKLAVRDCDDPGPRVTTLLSSCALRSKFNACFRPSCRPTMKNHRRAPECKSPGPCGRNGTEMPRLGKILQSPKLERNALVIVGLRPKIRTSSFAVSHTRLAALPWGPCLAIGRRRRGPRQRRSGLDSYLRWRSGKGPLLAKRLPDTQHRVGFAKFPVEVLPRRSARPLYDSPLYTPDANGNVGRRHFLCWYRST